MARNAYSMSRRDALGLLTAGAGLTVVHAVLKPALALAQPGRWQAVSSATRPTFQKGSFIRTLVKDIAPEELTTGSVQIHEHERPIDFAEMDRRLQPHGVVRHNDFVLKFWHDPYEMTLFPDGRAIIKGTTDTAIARSLYARYVGS